MSTLRQDTIATLREHLPNTASGCVEAIIREVPGYDREFGDTLRANIEAAVAMAEDLLSAVGQTVRLESESQMDAVTAVSGSGPAYVFHLIEALAAAGARAVIQPGGSMRDDEVIAAADRLGLAMVFTGQRHFRH